VPYGSCIPSQCVLVFWTRLPVLCKICYYMFQYDLQNHSLTALVKYNQLNMCSSCHHIKDDVYSGPIVLKVWCLSSDCTVLLHHHFTSAAKVGEPNHIQHFILQQWQGPAVTCPLLICIIFILVALILSSRLLCPSYCHQSISCLDNDNSRFNNKILVTLSCTLGIIGSSHHIEEADAGLDGPLYLRNKCSDKTLK